MLAKVPFTNERLDEDLSNYYQDSQRSYRDVTAVLEAVGHQLWGAGMRTSTFVTPRYCFSTSYFIAGAACVRLESSPQVQQSCLPVLMLRRHLL